MRMATTSYQSPHFLLVHHLSFLMRSLPKNIVTSYHNKKSIIKKRRNFSTDQTVLRYKGRLMLILW